MRRNGFFPWGIRDVRLERFLKAIFPALPEPSIQGMGGSGRAFESRIVEFDVDCPNI